MEGRILCRINSWDHCFGCSSVASRLAYIVGNVVPSSCRARRRRREKMEFFTEATMSRANARTPRSWVTRGAMETMLISSRGRRVSKWSHHSTGMAGAGSRRRHRLISLDEAQPPRSKSLAPCQGPWRHQASGISPLERIRILPQGRKHLVRRTDIHTGM